MRTKIVKHSRRTFLKSTAALAGTAIVKPRLSSAEAIRPAVTPQLSQFGYADVTLLDGPLRQQFDTNHAFYLALNEDSLLKPYRQRAGLPAPGEDMGGWYSWAPLGDLNAADSGFCPGHTFGQWVSGLSRDYAATGDKATQEKVHRLVAGFAPAITGHFWDDNRFPAYIYDKISIGMIDAHQFAGAPLAFKALDAALDSVQPHLPPGPLSRAEQYQRPHKDESFCWDEPYTLPENQFLAWQRGAGSRYRDLGIRYLADSWYWDPLAAGGNVLPGKHAYSHVNAMSSAMQAYFVLGQEKYLRAATNGLRMVQEQSYATGGWGPNEAFVVPGKGLLAASLNTTHADFETPCGAYGHFKVARYLLRTTRDSRYGDSMERVLYNTVAGAKPILADGTSFYYSDYNNAKAHKVYYKMSWPCCSGTFPQLTADYGISSYLSASDGVYVNLYIPSKITWQQNGTRCTMTQQTGYPKTNTTSLVLEMDRPQNFTLYLRIPAWTDASTRLSINGKRETASITPGSFFALKRQWKSGDRVELEIGMPLRAEPVDAQTPNTVALMRGPLAMFAVGNLPSHITQEQLLAATAVSQSSDDWNAQVGAEKLTLRPFTAIGDETYRLYLPIET